MPFYKWPIYTRSTFSKEEEWRCVYCNWGIGSGHGGADRCMGAIVEVELELLDRTRADLLASVIGQKVEAETELLDRVRKDVLSAVVGRPDNNPSEVGPDDS